MQKKIYITSDIKALGIKRPNCCYEVFFDSDMVTNDNSGLVVGCSENVRVGDDNCLLCLDFEEKLSNYILTNPRYKFN